ncbi:hypothetical protein ACFZBU_43580 [Embleya sp. NPDC008237]|uniref:nSTAND1 domain-containing NTPase n=1 Tax=Embleya sp. NPDC008237 TaxID=3363978 RepID=UPI0036EB5E5B
MPRGDTYISAVGGGVAAGRADALHVHGPVAVYVRHLGRLAAEHTFLGPEDGAPRVADGREPYPGMRAFGAADDGFFHGREALILDLVARLRDRVRGGGVQVVVGPSGAGKSSLVHAGLYPRLRDDSRRLPGDPLPREVVVFTPTEDPDAAWARAFPGDAATRADVADDPTAEHSRDGPRSVVVVDQFEELFHACPDPAARHRLVERLAETAAPGERGAPPGALVVIAVRADCYDACLAHPVLRDAFADRPLAVSSLTPAELVDAITRPAFAAGLRVETRLIAQLLSDLASPDGEAGEHADGGSFGPEQTYDVGRLPHLAHALRQTWLRRVDDRLTLAAYRSSGGIRGAMAKSADTALATLDGPVAREQARLLFLRLVRVGAGTRDTRRRVSRAELLAVSPHPNVLPRVVEAFTAPRLLTQYRDTVEITHEVLLRAWPRLQEWIDADRAGLLLRQRLDEAATHWAATPAADAPGKRRRGDSGRLYRGDLLAEALKYAKAHPGVLGSTSAAFLHASEDRAKRRLRAGRGVVAVIVALALLASVAAIVAFNQRDSARRQERAATSREFAAQSGRLAAERPAGALLAAGAAYAQSPTIEARSALLSADSTFRLHRFSAHRGSVEALARSADGRMLASGGADGVVRVWGPSGEPLSELPVPDGVSGDAGAITELAFGADDRLLATGRADGVVRVWDLATGRATAAFPGPTRPRSLAFGGNGRFLAIGRAEADVEVRDPTGDGPPLPLAGAADVARGGLAFLPDGASLAVVTGKGDFEVWRVAADAPPRRVSTARPAEASGGFLAVAWSGDARIVATASGFSGIQVWDVTSGNHLSAPSQYAVSLDAPALGPDARTLAVADPDSNKVHVFDATTGVRTGTLTGVGGLVRTLRFSADGRSLAAGDADGDILTWTLDEAALPAPRALDIQALAASRDGRRYATARVNGLVELWDSATHRRVAVLGEVGAAARSVAFSPDGTLVAAGIDSGAVRLWTATDRPRLVHTLVGHVGAVAGVAFSPDGGTLVSSGADGTGRLWAVSTGAPLSTIEGLSYIHDIDVYRVTFSPDGHNVVFAGDDGQAKLVDLTGRGRNRLYTNFGGMLVNMFDVAYSPDGRTLATGMADGTVWLWDSATGRLRNRLPGHTGAVSAVAFSPDGRTLASAGGDHTVRLWNLADAAEVATLTGHAAPVRDLVFAPSGDTLLSADADGVVRTWPLDPEAVLRRLCATLGEPVSPTLWAYLAPGVAYWPGCRTTPSTTG